MWWLNQRQEDEAAEGEAAGGGQAGAGSVRAGMRMACCRACIIMVLYCRPHLWAYTSVRTVTLYADRGCVRDIVMFPCVVLLVLACMQYVAMCHIAMCDVLMCWVLCVLSVVLSCVVMCGAVMCHVLCRAGMCMLRCAIHVRCRQVSTRQLTSYYILFTFV